MVPSGASQVGSRTLLAFASWPRVLSAMTQSSLHQPGSCEASSQVYTRSAPSGSVTSIWPALTSSSVHDIGEPAPTGLPPLVAATGCDPNLTSQSRWVGPVAVARAFSRMRSARIAHASSRVSARIWTRSKKSQSAGYALILLWAADPEIDSAVMTCGGRSSKPTIVDISRNRARSSGWKSSIVTRWP